MAVTKDLDKRFNTRGGSIRIETWIDVRTKAVTKYNLAYINHRIFGGDNGRVVGFDNSHTYVGHGSAHHYHWFGRVLENTKFTTFDDTLVRFQRYLRRLKHHYGKDY